MYERVADTVDVRFGDGIAALAQGPDGVAVTFESGATETYDLVAGADGLRSRTRALASGATDEAVPNHPAGLPVTDPGPAA